LPAEAVGLTPSLAPGEGAGAERLAERMGVRHLTVESHELDDPRYRRRGGPL
jgi:hypothetical protein